MQRIYHIVIIMTTRAICKYSNDLACLLWSLCMFALFRRLYTCMFRRRMANGACFAELHDRIFLLHLERFLNDCLHHCLRYLSLCATSPRGEIETNKNQGVSHCAAPRLRRTRSRLIASVWMLSWVLVEFNGSRHWLCLMTCSQLKWNWMSSASVPPSVLVTSQGSGNGLGISSTQCLKLRSNRIL